MSTKHTPGPWNVRPYEPFIVEDEGDLAIATMDKRRGYDTEAANAQLIAAAPELLEALTSIVAWTKFELGPDLAAFQPWRSVLANCEAAISKAEGQSPSIKGDGE